MTYYARKMELSRHGGYPVMMMPLTPGGGGRDDAPRILIDRVNMNCARTTVTFLQYRGFEISPKSSIRRLFLFAAYRRSYSYCEIRRLSVIFYYKRLSFVRSDPD